MAQVIITFKLMPESPDVDLEAVKSEALKKIAEFSGAAWIKCCSAVPIPYQAGRVCLDCAHPKTQPMALTDDFERSPAFL